jgi:hypothetical protein
MDSTSSLEVAIEKMKENSLLMIFGSQTQK